MSVLLVLACTDAPGGTDTSDDVAFDGIPEWGTWDLTLHSSDYDTCGLTTEEERADPCSRGCGEFELIDDGDGGFTMSATFQPDYSLDCQLDPMGFTCTPLVGTHEVDGLDGLVTEWDGVYGVFDSATSYIGGYTFERTCEGTECPEVEAELAFDVDCVLIGRLAATLVE